MDCKNSERKGATRVRVSNVSLIEYANTNRKEGYFNDTTIEMGKETISANRMVLSFYCPYFEKMFKSNFKENRSAKLEMQKIDGKAFSLLIEFIYTGVITIDNDNVMELLAAADYLQLDEVRQFCLEEIESKKGETRVRISSLGVLEYANTNRKKGCFNDVTIEVEGESIPANRMVLSCCCPYFEKMFKSNLKESKSGKLELQGIDRKAVSSLIEYIYTGVIKFDNDNVMEVLAAADFLQLDEVKQFCFEYLETTINQDTCCVILSTANLYGQQKLLDDTFRFLELNFEKVKGKAVLSKSDLTLCIAKMDRNWVTENLIYQFLIDWTYNDIESREKDFHEMFQLLNFRNLTSEFLKNVVSNEKLVTTNLATSIAFGHADTLITL